MRNVLLALVLAGIGLAASADETMRCGNSLVAIPVSLEELLRKCGEPDEKAVSAEDIRSSGKTGSASRVIGTTRTERWTYRSASQSLPMIVTIVDGRVTKIERGQ